jgi:hypothetical protein
MRVRKFRLAAVVLVSSIALGGCAYDMYGDGYGYDPYGYGYGYGYPRSSVSIGIGYGSGYGSYGYGGYGYGGYGYPYGGYDPFGWYGGSYYPGTGIFVYDSYRRPHRWSGDQERYWTTRRTNWQGRTGTSWHRDNWNGFNRSGTTTTTGGHWHHRG